LMQQQMFEQFQQTVLMMLQLFSSMHQDQMATIREELARLHTVTRELEVLQKRVAEHPPAGALAGTGPQGTMGKEVALPAPKAGLPPANRNEEGERSPSKENKAASSGPAVSAAAVPVSPDGVQSGEKIHAWLSERVAALEQERQGRWQKILSLLRGG
jgi:hypothetical protein